MRVMSIQTCIHFLGHSIYKNSKLILTRTERGSRVVSTYASYSGSPAFKSRHRRRATLTEVFPVIGNAIYIVTSSQVLYSRWKFITLQSSIHNC
jgi:hypothetical protein